LGFGISRAIYIFGYGAFRQWAKITVIITVTSNSHNSQQSQSCTMDDSDGNSRTTAKAAAPTPLQITSLVDLSSSVDGSSSPSSSKSGKYHVLQRLVTAHPFRRGSHWNSNDDDTSIETTLEHWRSFNDDIDTSWMRVAVYSGPDGCRTLHASYQLPAEAHPSSLADQDGNTATLCWAAFPEQPNHPLLCVLVHSTAVCLWDVYPDKKSLVTGGDGWTVSLPFDCCGIHAIGNSGGVLLQRLEDVEDYSQDESQHVLNAVDEDDGFFLKAPPKLARMMADSANQASPAAWSSQPPPASSLPMSMTPSVSSLFSLQHPLADILPVSQLFTGDVNALHAVTPVTDVFEKVIWVGTAQWASHDDVDSQKTSLQCEQVLLVTYHTTKQRHAVWLVQDAPPPAETAPLWQRSRQWRQSEPEGQHDWNALRDHDEVDLAAAEFLANTSAEEPIPAASVSRTDALADALGVRRQTPRQPMPVGRESRSHPRNIEQSQQQQQSSLFSPRANQSMSSTSVWHETADIPSMGADQALGPFSSMHSKIAVTCVFEGEMQTAQATQVFLASNAEASGTLTLAMMCESIGDSANHKELWLYSLKPNSIMSSQSTEPDSQTSFHVELVMRLPCTAAQPINTTPVPLCFSSHSKGRPRGEARDSELATDILVLAKCTGESVLTLYRANLPLTSCSLPVNSLKSILNIADPVKDRVSLTWMDTAGAVHSVRGRCTLVLPSSALSERALSAIDAALFVEQNTYINLQLVEAALKMRADCCRLAQTLSQSTEETTSLLADASWSAIETVLTSIIEQELLGKTTLSRAPADSSQGDAWTLLLESDFHHSYTLDTADSLFLGAVPSTNNSLLGKDRSRHLFASIGSSSIEYLAKVGLGHVVPRLFDALHLLYEDLKLEVASAEDLFRLASILVRTCRSVKVADPTGSLAELFLDYYRRDLGDDILSTDQEALSPTLENIGKTVSFTSAFRSPASFFQWADQLMQQKNTEQYYGVVSTSDINAACSTTRSVHRILKVIFTGDSETRDFDTVTTLLEEGFTDVSMVQERLPAGIALPILEVLFRCRCDPALANVTSWPVQAWSLVGRDDLSRNTVGAPSGFSSCIAEPTKAVTGGEEAPIVDEDNDGLAPLERRAAMLFPEDNRIHEAARLLRSCRPIFLRVSRAVEVSDHDYEKQKQSKLLLLSRRALALATGRGMLTLGSLRPVAAEPLPLPELVLKGRVPPTNALLNLDVTNCPSDMTVWPEFHNGVAAGLRLPSDGDPLGSDFKITRTWIVYNRPPSAAQSNEDGNDAPAPPHQKSHAHGGLLLALGLRGHLIALEMSDLYEYLTQGTVTTTVGVLLGMAANKRGTCDMSVSKMLCLHIPSLIPQHFSAIDVASPVQTAAVTGAGLLFQRSSHRMMTEFLLNEIGKRPDSDMSAFDREAYTLSCGLALGMVNLCLGERTSDIDRAAGIADLRVEERLYRYIVGGVDSDETRRTRESNDRFSLPSSTNGGDNEKCSIIFEGNSINTDVTAPGAVLALGLMYMKTSNQNIASAIDLPDTHFLLEFVRPDFLAHRVVSRALILWNEVQPTREWIDGQVPLVVRKAYNQMRTEAANGMVGRLAGSKSRKQPDYDRRAIRQIYVHVVAGACFGLGLRFAGTGDKRAADALFERVQELHALREANDGVAVALRPEFPILETCLSCTAISLAMVLAGTGDLEALKLFKILRWRCDGDINYGSHTVYGMAIGLLFLGGGTCTLGREPEDIAALVTAFFPRYPTTTSDNQYHLQALRHLYALAVKRKQLSAVDVDTGESVSVPVEVRGSSTLEVQRLTLPCLLMNSDSPLEELRVVSDKYYPVTLNLESIAPSYTFFVKERSAKLHHFPCSSGQRMEKMAPLVRSLTENPFLLAYSKYFCDNGNDSGSRQAANPVGWDDSRVLLESLSAEEALFLYLTLDRGIAAMQQQKQSADGCASLTFGRCLWNLRLVRTYYQERLGSMGNPSSSSKTPMLIDTDLLAYLHERTERLLVSKVDNSDGPTAVGGLLSFYDP
jgi:anaphase-promoting complex subunit 1